MRVFDVEALPGTSLLPPTGLRQASAEAQAAETVAGPALTALLAKASRAVGLGDEVRGARAKRFEGSRLRSTPQWD